MRGGVKRVLQKVCWSSNGTAVGYAAHGAEAGRLLEVQRGGGGGGGYDNATRGRRRAREEREGAARVERCVCTALYGANGEVAMHARAGAVRAVRSGQVRSDAGGGAKRSGRRG